MSSIKRAITVGYWQDQSLGDLWTKEEIQELAPRYYRFTTRYTPQVSWIKEINPDSLVMYYRNFEGVYYGTESGLTNPWNEFPHFVENDAVLKNVYGDYLINRSFPIERLVDPANQWYRDYLRNLIRDTIETYGYDAIFADNVRPRYPDASWHYGTPRAINPRTGLEYTLDEYHADVMGLINYVKGSYKIVFNGINQADSPWGYLANASRAESLINATHGMMIEGPWGWSLSDFNSRSVETWKANVDLLAQLMRVHPNKFQDMTNPSAINNMIFAFCSFMLAVSGDNWSVKYGGWRQLESEEWQTLTNYNYGKPLENYQINGDVCSRKFEYAIIYVNPFTKQAGIEETEGPPPTPTPSVALPVIMIGAGLTMNNPLIGIPILLTGAGLYYLQRRG